MKCSDVCQSGKSCQNLKGGYLYLHDMQHGIGYKTAHCLLIFVRQIYATVKQSCKKWSELLRADSSDPERLFLNFDFH